MIPLRFRRVWDFSEGLAAVEFSDAKDQWGYIDHAGSVVIKPQFGDAGFFKEGLAPVAIHFKYGYVDKKGNLVIEPQFEHACTFSEGLACVVNAARKYGFIDASGRFVIEPKYDLGFDFQNGLAMVSRNGNWEFNELTFTGYQGEWGHVTKTGLEIWDTSGIDQTSKGLPDRH